MICCHQAPVWVSWDGSRVPITILSLKEMQDRVAPGRKSCCPYLGQAGFGPIPPHPRAAGDRPDQLPQTPPGKPVSNHHGIPSRHQEVGQPIVSRRRGVVPGSLNYEGDTAHSGAPGGSATFAPGGFIRRNVTVPKRNPFHLAASRMRGRRGRMLIRIRRRGRFPSGRNLGCCHGLRSSSKPARPIFRRMAQGVSSQTSHTSPAVRRLRKTAYRAARRCGSHDAKRRPV